MIRGISIASLLLAGALLSAPASAASDEELLDEITIRMIDDETPSIEVNELAMPPLQGQAGDNNRGPASENADQRAAQGAENAAGKARDITAEKAEKAAENAARAAENAAEAREKANEAAEKGKGKGKDKN